MNKLTDFLKFFIPYSLILFGLQYYIMESLFADYGFFYSAWSIYAFNVIATILVYLLLLYINKILPTYTGFTFLGASLFRMIAAVVFLIPFIKSHSKDPIGDVTAFFVPYFLFLLFETYFTIRLINRS
jgi:hypothetical protein